MSALGHKPDVPDPRDWSVTHHPQIGAAPKLTRVTLRVFVRRVWDQGGTSSCVGQALSAAVEVRAGLQKIEIPEVSRLAVYANGRTMPLVDDGSMPRQVAAEMAHRGLVAESRWPFSEAKVDDVPPFDVYAHGVGARLGGYYRILASGQDRVDQVRQALAAGYPVGWATQVDAVWDGYTSGIMGDYDGSPSRGGHYTLIVGVGDNYVEILNSWGTSWGEGGFARVSLARIASYHSTDFLAVTLAPEGVS